MTPAEIRETQRIASRIIALDERPKPMRPGDMTSRRSMGQAMMFWLLCGLFTVTVWSVALSIMLYIWI